MPKSKPTSLPEKDYLAILDMILQFHDCRTRGDLLNTFKNNLLPFFNSQAGLYACTDHTFAKSNELLGYVGIPDNEVKVFLESAPYQTINKSMLDQARSVFAHDVDFPRKRSNEDADCFFKANPHYKRKNYPYFDRVNSGLVAADIPEPTLAVALHRLDKYDMAWTLRDIRIMELLRPHLLQTIRTICMNEELAKFKTLAEALADSLTATALVSGKMQVFFQNQAFTDIFRLDNGRKLPKNLIELLEHETAKYDPPFKADDGGIELPFCSTDKDRFRLNFALIGKESEDKCWLIRLQPAVEPLAKMNLLMQNKGLTAREMEICVLLKDGIDIQKIADRLFISIHTLRTHMRNIHRKMGVHTGAQLVAALNREMGK